MQLFRYLGVPVGWMGILGLVLLAPCVNAARDKTPEVKQTFTELMAQEIEARIVALQVAYASADPKSVHFLNQAVSSFYAQRQYRPAWNDKERLATLIAAIESLDTDGLNPADYQLNQLLLALPLVGDESPGALSMRVDDELRATNAYLRALYHLFNGKVDPAGLDPQWNFELEDLAQTSLGAELMNAVETGNIQQLFARTRPQHPIYSSLMAGLKRYRELAAQGGWPSLPVGETLKPCMVNPQVAILRQRLKVTGEYLPLITEAVDVSTQTPAQKCLGADTPLVTAADTNTSSSASSSVAGIESTVGISKINPDEVFDEYLVEAVKKFQRDQYLEDDGSVGPATRAALNISVQTRIDQIRVNLDRARWLLHNIPPDMLLVDVAGFKITYFKASQPIWRSRVQVGMAYRTSPIFKSEVNYITLNPTWTVPPTILRKDVLPKVRKDINYLKAHNIRVLDSEGKELDPHTIDWARPGNVTLRQDAGDDAALGKAVIRFPNSYSVYLHDTPHQKLFNKSQRAFSSGCIRVERALELVELLLAETPGWDQRAINQALDTGKTRNVTLAKRVPILLAYWTVDAISEDHIAFKPDIYARDSKVLAALNRTN